jgi:hypothetical protein
MSLISTLPDNKIGADDIQAVNAISNALSSNGSKQYNVHGFYYDSGSDTKYYHLTPRTTINDITSVQSNVIINVDSTNTILYYTPEYYQYNPPGYYQYNSYNRYYNIKLSLNVTYPTNISFYGTNNLPFIDMGGINQTSLPIGKYYLIFKYYLENNVCFYRILK